MTLQFASGMMIGMGLTLFSIFSIVEYMNHKELKKSEKIMDLTDELNRYRYRYKDGEH